MKQYLSLALILIFTVANSFSQTKDNSPEAQAKAMVSKVHKAIFLQGDEWTNVNNAFTTYYKEIESIKNQKVIEATSAQVKINTLRTELNEKLTAALSAERMRIWTAYKEKEKIEE